jgi:hypothetical protein
MRLVLLIALAPTALAHADPAAEFRDLCAKQAAGDETMTVAGSDGWLFLRSELRHLGVGPFWGEAAAKVSRASSPDKADPLPAIVDFHEQMKKLGIQLILVPVPCKAVVYPEKLGGPADGRLDTVHQEFYRLLTDKGVEVLDLTEDFRADREAQPYCKTDSHWSGRGIELAAKKIASRIENRDWQKREFQTEARETQITGDLGGTETLPLRYVTGGEPSRESPVVLLGDSHTLVFHAGDDMHTRNAGLPDQLAVELGTPVDLIGVRGSGATPARVNLLRLARANPDFLAKKKVIIWCFTAREFTESQGWSKVPIVKE